MDIIFKKNGKGHDVFVDGLWQMWVTGSKRNANKEIQNYLKEQNE
ncbi:hypothetical protein [Tenacibaculum piscium]|nr:hypothetical protein [Tenacibaculum piscium]